MPVETLREACIATGAGRCSGGGGLVNIVLMTAMATIAAFVYNLTTDLIGGVEVTLADLD